jgi:hypothetical protein
VHYCTRGKLVCDFKTDVDDATLYKYAATLKVTFGDMISPIFQDGIVKIILML